MIEFFNSIKEWFVANGSTISAIFDALTTGAVGATIVFIAKLIVTNKANNGFVNKLAEAVKSNDEGNLDTRETLKALVSGSDTLSGFAEKFAKALGAAQEKIEEMQTVVNTKLDSLENLQNVMLDMFGVVYSTIKDENVRSTVQNIITNAKYGKTTVKEEVQAQLEELQASFAAKMEAMQKELTSMVATTNSIIDPASDATDTKKDATGEKNGVSRL